MTTATLEEAVNRWHEAVNRRSADEARATVTDPVVVLGPKGAGRIGADDFVDWIDRSGITLTARSWHPVGDRFLVVEQDARWPADDGPTLVATVFRSTCGRVSAALRLPDLRSALDLALICSELDETP
jgi:hypothetical protein